MTVREKGQLSERAAADYLISNGYEILESNYHSRFGEIDLIARDEKKILYVEVKGRSSNFERPGEAVSPSKIKKIMKTAYNYAAKNNVRIPHRFDIIEVYFTIRENKFTTLKIVHFKNTFPR